MGTPGMWQGQPGWPQGGAGWPDQGAQYAPQFPPMPPPMPRPSPFAGVPRSDLILDAACVVAVVAVLVLPWNMVDRGFNRPEVIVALVLALVAPALPYLSRMGLFGPSWGPANVRVTKMLFAAPLALCAAGYFVADAALGAVDGQVTEYAVACGAWIAVAASALAAVPRRSDLVDPAAAMNVPQLWVPGLTAVGFAMVFGAALALIGVVVGVYRTRQAAIELRALLVWPVAQAILLGLWVLAVFFVVRRATRGDEAARLTLTAVGAGALIWALLNAFISFSVGSTESIHLPFAAVALTMVAAVIAISPALPDNDRRADPQTWFSAAASTCKLIVAANLLLLAQVIIAVLLTGALTTVVFLTAACAGLGAVAADWARQQVSLSGVRARTPVLIAASVQALAGLVLIIVTGQSSNAWEAITAFQVIAAIALPAAAAAFVLLPHAVRTLFPSAPPPLMYSDPMPQPAQQVYSGPGNAAAQTAYTGPDNADLQTAHTPRPAPPAFYQATDESTQTVHTPPAAPASPTAYIPTSPPSAPTAASSAPTPAEPTAQAPSQAPPFVAAPMASERASDPSTPSQELWELARSDQSVLPFIAANPSAPPDLIAWLTQNTDPAVRASLRARGDL